MRRCLQNEYSAIYIINLRGDIRKNMKSKDIAKEGENVFKSGCMNGIAITLFVRNPYEKQPCKIYYHDIGNNLSTKEKLERLRTLRSVKEIVQSKKFIPISPNEKYDWIKKRNADFDQFISMGNKNILADAKFFEIMSPGVLSNRDAWVYNFSYEKLDKSIQKNN